jgi:hypothetical protein
MNSPAEIPEAGLFVLPGGYVADDGALHCEVELSPLTGMLEERLFDVPFHTPSAGFITILLAGCVKRLGTLATVDAEVVKGLLVGDREYLLVRLRQMAFGAEVEAVWRCVNAHCRKPMDISFSLAELQIERKAVAARFFTHKFSLVDSGAVAEAPGLDGCEVKFRLPTGADQEALAGIFHLDPDAAVYQLLARCLQNGGGGRCLDAAEVAQWPAAARHELYEAMERLAPQVAIELDLTCPECRTSFVADFDFTAFFLAEMTANARRLEREVHLLARHYHWSEQEILSLTRKKRQRYIELLQEEIERLN